MCRRPFAPLFVRRALWCADATVCQHFVLLVGDSVNKLWFYWLRRNQVRGQTSCRIVHAHTNHLLPDKSAKIAAQLCAKPWWICPPANRRSTSTRDWRKVHMDGVSENGTHLGDGQTCFIPESCWWDKRWLRTFSVIVVNSGAHYVPATQYQQQLNFLHKTVSVGAAPHAVLIWRNTVPGHADCELAESRAPFDSLDAAERAVSNHSWFQGARFQQLNRLAEQYLCNLTAPRQPWRLLDVYSSTVLRRDGHIVVVPGSHRKDCLHHCTERRERRVLAVRRDSYWMC